MTVCSTTTKTFTYEFLVMWLFMEFRRSQQVLPDEAIWVRSSGLFIMCVFYMHVATRVFNLAIKVADKILSPTVS